MPVLNEAQRRAVKIALGDGSSWPLATDDPVVNWAVDCASDPHTEYDPEIYEGEVAAYRESATEIMRVGQSGDGLPYVTFACK